MKLIIHEHKRGKLWLYLHSHARQPVTFQSHQTSSATPPKLIHPNLASSTSFWVNSMAIWETPEETLRPDWPYPYSVMFLRFGLKSQAPELKPWDTNYKQIEDLYEKHMWYIFVIYLGTVGKPRFRVSWESIGHILLFRSTLHYDLVFIEGMV